MRSKSTHSQKPKLSMIERVPVEMGDHYVLGFAPALRFPRTQSLCRLYKSPSDETINQGPPVYMYAERSPMRALKIL